MTGDQGTTRVRGGEQAQAKATAEDADADRIDAVAWWQLVGLTVLGAGAPVVYFVLQPGPVPWVTVVVLGLALGIALPAGQVRSWERRGGRAAVLATREWVRSGHVPATVPDAVWRPRVQRSADDLRRRRLSTWVALGLTVLWVVVALTGTIGDWVVVLLWAAIAVAGLVQDRGARAAAERLLATAS